MYTICLPSYLQEYFIAGSSFSRHIPLLSPFIFVAFFTIKIEISGEALRRNGLLLKCYYYRYFLPFFALGSGKIWEEASKYRVEIWAKNPLFHFRLQRSLREGYCNVSLSLRSGMYHYSTSPILSFEIVDDLMIQIHLTASICVDLQTDWYSTRFYLFCLL